MEDANWTTDERLVGQWVQVPIDRLDLSPAGESGWPGGLAPQKPRQTGRQWNEDEA